tara:strand:+ start:5424 stop:6089 length:666 start_codon:yes stop_codon:yes gene_type:complete
MVLRQIVNYDINKWDFRSIVEEYLDNNKLECLHEHCEKYEVFTRASDQSTIFHSAFYKGCELDNKFDSLYKRFVKNYVSKMFIDERLVYQKRPSFRVALTDNKSVGEWHKDSNYQHPFEEINFFIPLTDCKNTNTIWVETNPDSKKYEPINLNYGQIFVFSGGLLNHGNKINTTGKTRVSFDFRVIKSVDYDKIKNLGISSSVNTNKSFIVGDYYERLQSD